MRLHSHSRVLLLAPHPDDEAIGTGGLVQRAMAAGGQVHVIFATNGDDNPWPHRVLERRWKIEIADRMLWGMRRAQEALDALRVLGVPAKCADYLHLPDQRITELLLEAPEEVLERLVAIIEQVRPNLVVMPSPFDVHPDHSSLHLLMQLALSRAGRSDVEQVCYVIHTRARSGHSDWERVPFELTDAERAIKRRAILAHHTQMVLSKNRFLRYAETEEYWRPSAPRAVDVRHPVRCGHVGETALVLQLHRRKRARSFSRCTALLAFEDERGRLVRWSIPLRSGNGEVAVRDPASGVTVAVAHLEARDVHAQLRISLLGRTPAVRVFAKLQEPSIFFDTAGWREIPAAASQAALIGLLPINFPRSRKMRRPLLKAKAAR